jgi:transcriptional regulator with XRE-family HTH domain
VTDRTRPWQQLGYSDIVAAFREGDAISVEFANGDTEVVPAGLLGLPATDFEVTAPTDDSLGIHVTPQGGEPVEIGWMQLRIASDPDFAQEMRRRDSEESHRIGLRLKALREDRGVRQRDLAQLAQMPPSQLAKIESGSLDMRFSTVRTLLRAMDATFADISGDDAPEVSVKTIVKRLSQAGVDAKLATHLGGAVERNKVALFVARAFDISPEALTAARPAFPLPAVSVRFKGAGPKQPERSPLVRLALVVSRLVQTTTDTQYRSVPRDARAVRQEILNKEGEVTLGALLEWAWGRGLAVMPMSGRGGFVAAAWTVAAAPVVVLKDARDIVSFWLFDLAHEIGHIARGHIERDGIVDVESPALTDTDKQEREANEFALKLLIPNYRELLEQVRGRSQPEKPRPELRFKDAVASVAREARVSPGLLGLVAAFELTDVAEHKDRWGSAINLDKRLGSGRAEAQEAARAHLTLDSLDELDRALLETVVFGSESEK